MLTVALICTLCFAAGRQSAAACRWMGRAASVIIILESSMIVPGPGTSEGDPAWHSESGTQGRDGSPGNTTTATHIARRGPAPLARLAGPGPLARAMNVALRLAASQSLSSRPRAGRSTDIRIECSAVNTFQCIFMARITGRDNKRFVSYGFCH